MPNFKSILFPVDFSEPCRAIAPSVNSLSRRFGAHLTLLHCIQIPPDSYLPHSARLIEELKQEIRQTIDESMRAFVTREFESSPVQCVIEEGDPGNRVVKYTQSHGIDLVVMPTHGYGPFRRFLIGSVAAKVLHDVQCPVWTSAHIDKAPTQAKGGYETILCAVDSGESSVPLMRWASSLAGQYGATLKLAHIVPAVDEASTNPGVIEVCSYLFSKAREDFTVWRQQAGVKAELLLRGGSVAGAIAEIANEEKADLLVVGRGRIQRALGGLRAHSLPIIREAPCPVISV